MAEVPFEQAMQTAVQQHRLGRLSEAESIYRQALALRPGEDGVMYLLGLVCHQTGRNAEALELLGRAIEINPTVGRYHGVQSAVCHALGQIAQAIEHGRRAVAIEPTNADALVALGTALKDAGGLDEAIDCFRRAVAIRPGAAGWYNNLGILLKERGRLEESIAAHRRAVELQPSYAEGYSNLGNAQRAARRHEEAMASYQRAIALKADYPEAHNNLGTVLQDLGRTDEAVSAYRKAIALRPGFALAQNNLGTALKHLGLIEEAVTALRKALELQPSYAEAHSNLLLAMQYDSVYDAAAIRQELLEWDRRHAQPLLTLIRPHGNNRDPNRRLRVGYVSPDFREHPVAYFIEPVLAAHDGAQVQSICYAQVAVEDAVTHRLRGLAGQWRNIVGMTDQQVADQIRADQVDILVDLAGHTAHHRLKVFAIKPAPVQVTWIGYPDTTGLGTIDYRLTDAVADPKQTSGGYHTEELVRLPTCFLCYRPPAEAPAVSVLPAATRGHVTFGSFNNWTKVRPQTLALWAKVLLAVPGSRLLLKAKALGQASRQRFVREVLAGHDVAVDRIRTIGSDAAFAAHLRAYDNVDVALDPFPYNGTTTTCESLWMGVPVVTLAGREHRGRVGASLLRSVGLEELVAADEARYVEIAARLASDVAGLGRLRAKLRERIRQSPLTDARSFVAGLEAAYREMWQRYCLEGSSA